MYINIVEAMKLYLYSICRDLIISGYILNAYPTVIDTKFVWYMRQFSIYYTLLCVYLYQLAMCNCVD